MDALNEICGYFPRDTADELLSLTVGKTVTDVRLRLCRKPRVSYLGGDAAFGHMLSREDMRGYIDSMLEHSLYAWEDELGQGFFTLPTGSRVGVSGRYSLSSGRAKLACATSLCLRIAREVKNCAIPAVERILANGRAKSAMFISPPCMGKTTMLRDSARLLSNAGLNVCIADERGELAACRSGVPTLDLGERTDIAEGLPKSEAIARMLRSMSPDVIVTDELGASRDVQAVSEAARMGVSVLASAHASSLSDACARPALKEMLLSGAFGLIFVLGNPPGTISEIYQWREEDSSWH